MIGPDSGNGACPPDILKGSLISGAITKDSPVPYTLKNYLRFFKGNLLKVIMLYNN